MLTDHERIRRLEEIVEWQRRELNRLRSIVEPGEESGGEETQFIGPITPTCTGSGWIERQSEAQTTVTPAICARCHGKGHYDGCRCACMPDMSCKLCKGSGWYLIYEGKATKRVACECLPVAPLTARQEREE